MRVSATHNVIVTVSADMLCPASCTLGAFYKVPFGMGTVTLVLSSVLRLAHLRLVYSSYIHRYLGDETRTYAMTSR